MARPHWLHALSPWLAAALALGCARSAMPPVPAEPGSRLAGEVREISIGEGRLTLADAGRLRVVTVTPETIVRRGRVDSSLAELSRGDRILVSVAAEPPHAARLIAIAGPARSGGDRRFGVPLP